MTRATAEKILESFPHPTIQPIVGKPNYESIAEVHLKLNANTASMRSNLGNGRLGHLFLTLQPEVFNALSTIEFVPPNNPGQNTVAPDGATGPQIAEARRMRQERHEDFKRYDQIDKALKSLLIEAEDEAHV